MIKSFFAHIFVLALCAISLPVLAMKSFSDPLIDLNSKHWWLADGWGNGFPFLSVWKSDAVTFDGSGMSITLTGQESTEQSNAIEFVSGELRSQQFFSYGCFEIEMKPIAAPGVISSFFLFSGPYDKPKNGSGIHNEIDIEFLGMNTNMVQMNFWTDDDEYQNSHETLVFLDFDASLDFHHYAIYWHKDGIEWFIDGESVLKVLNSKYDPTPSKQSSTLRVMANVWATDPEISNWAGEFDTSSTKPLTASYRNFKYTAGKRCR
ncbi:glycosyl hydrolase family protein [Vibrio sp. T187]|uniref:family 16 glycosylhydrolase n=1 Tax=Vibrio TaxID=662 RepID=UPI0010C95E40|nr:MULTISPECIES: family 16 glycosylhydrolase [Vibrio]MBW3695784.1 glycosyl hydrolase family protein [Vibrio sp. T187]